MPRLWPVPWRSRNSSGGRAAEFSARVPDAALARRPERDRAVEAQAQVAAAVLLRQLRERAIRQVLKSIAVLAHTFDSAVSTVRYASNIMTFSRIEGMNEPARVKMRNEIRFSGGAGLETLQGVLLTNSALSATTLSDGPDSQLGQFSLPVPKEYERMIGGRPRYLVLPGAPHAFVTGESSRFADTSGLADWCREQGDFPQRVIEEIEDYFASDSGGSIRSFISLPLKKGGQCYAIVNIHRNTTGILLDQELVGRFVAILRPFELLLIALLDLLATMEDQ